MKNENKELYDMKLTDAQDGLHTLIDHFLGKDWYVADPLSSKQVNTIAIEEILKKYPSGKTRRIKNYASKKQL